MKAENLDTMLYYIEKSGISTENITGAHYKENSILLKRETKNKTTYKIDRIYVNLDEKSDTVIIKDENTYENINFKNNDKSYIFNLQTLIVYEVLNRKLNIYTMSVSQKVKNKKDIVKFNLVSEFYDDEKTSLLDEKAKIIISNMTSYDVPNDYIIFDGIPEINKEKVLIQKK